MQSSSATRDTDTKKWTKWNDTPEKIGWNLFKRPNNVIWCINLAITNLTLKEEEKKQQQQKKTLYYM